MPSSLPQDMIVSCHLIDDKPLELGPSDARWGGRLHFDLGVKIQPLGVTHELANISPSPPLPQGCIPSAPDLPAHGQAAAGRGSVSRPGHAVQRDARLPAGAIRGL